MTTLVLVFKKIKSEDKRKYETFKNSTKCWVCDTDYDDNDVKVKDHCRITGKYRGSAHRDCNINP